MTPPAPTTQEIRKLCEKLLRDIEVTLGGPVIIDTADMASVARWCLDRLDEQAADAAQSIAGMDVIIDPSVPDGMILVKDARSKRIVVSMLFKDGGAKS